MIPASPIAAAARLAGRRGRVLLHSGRDDDGLGRRSLVSCEPVRALEARGRRLVLRGADGEIRKRWIGDPLVALEQLVAGAGEAVAIGYLGYDLGRAIERLGRGPELGDDLPDLWFGLYDATARWSAGAAQPELTGDPDAVARLRAALEDGADHPGAPPELGPLVADDGADAYRDRIDRILDYIAAGDIYQVNLARRLVAPIAVDGDALAIYAALDRQAPAPYGGLIEADGAAVLSGSPELFLRRSAAGGRLETRPIKGTRRRDGDPNRAAELAADPKEQAEHLMIVDLERNDLGRIATIGSVRVDRLGYVVELPALYHLVSRVSCQPRPEVGLADILRATFPGGSITGAPKIRAMEIIDELEPARRGPYTGALGLLEPGGGIELAIAIRCAVLGGGELRLHVGGGVVADSTAERELEETEEKAAGWRAALALLQREVDEGEGRGAAGDRRLDVDERVASGAGGLEAHRGVEGGHAE